LTADVSPSNRARSGASLSQDQLEAWAEALGRVLRGGDVLLLHGRMGAGKTTFVRALARGLGIARPDRVCSPTFAVSLRHDGATPLVHVDLCRLGELGAQGDALGTSAAFESLGLADLADAFERRPAAELGVLAVEWAELWTDPPADHIAIALGPGDDPHTRSLHAVAHGGRSQERIDAWTIAAPIH
jgi:tRNA threonylcarbamoyl adenosine modification protein YjeE